MPLSGIGGKATAIGRANADGRGKNRLIHSKGRFQTAVGSDITVGMDAPDSVAIGQDWSEHYLARKERGKVLVLAEVT